MKREQPGLPVRYHHQEGEIILSGVEPGQRIRVHEEQPQRSRNQWCHGTRIWKIFLPISVVLIVAGALLAMFFFGFFKKVNIPYGLNKSVGVALPEVENLTVTAIGDDYFTLSWKRPLGSFHNYVVQVVLETIDEINDTNHEEQSVGLCLPVNIMNEDQTSITCNNVAACSNVTVTVHTQNNETRPRKSPGVSVPVFLPGGAPDEFSIHRIYYDFTSVGILIDASNVSSCQLGACYVQLQDAASKGEKLQCVVASKTQRLVYLRGLQTGKPYKYRVSLQNPYNLKEATRDVIVIAQ